MHQTGLEKIVYVKARLLPLCTHLWQDGRRMEMTAAWRQIEEAAAQMAGKLCASWFATRSVASLDENQFETRLCFVGMAGMIDPPKEGVKEAIELAHKAGIDVVMITGDHPETALAIGRKLGIAQSLSQVLTSVQMQDLSDDQLAQACQRIRIVARATPQD
ncbi:MAG: HAD family hydrolase, partial [Holdemania massiliensis]